MDDHFLNFYRVLGVDPGCSWVELKLAYRRLVRRWHPDQRAQTSEETDDAQIKAINTAFEALSEYYHRHGALPQLTDASQESELSTDIPQTEHVAPHTYTVHWPHVLHSRRSRGLRFVLIGAALAVIYAVVANLVYDKPSDENELLQSTVRQGTAKQPPASISLHQDRGQKPPQPVKSYFSPGSSIGEVIAAQGPPSRIEGDVWHYGKSRVYFQGGRVTHWEDDGANPLNTRLAAAAAPSTATLFGVGSTKPDVRAAQGTPMLETESMWDYGASRVYFKDGRVTSWEESPTRPLHLRR